MTFWKRQNSRVREQISGYQGLGMKGGFDYKGVVKRFCFKGDGTVVYFDCGGSYMTMHFFKTHKTVQPKRIISL